jgi:hypothetical protein
MTQADELISDELELIEDELEHVWGGKPIAAAPKDPPVPYLEYELKECIISGYSL